MDKEIIFEIKLRCNQDHFGYKVGDTFILVNNIFDPEIGIAFVPIDKRMDIVYKRQYIGIKDRNGNKVFDSDIIKNSSATEPEDKGFIVIFENFKWIALNIRHPNDPRYSFDIDNDICSVFDKIGNVLENPDLLK